MRRPQVTFQLGVFLGALIFAVCELFLEVHVPGTDVFLFKEAGVNLATKGKFVAAYLPHMVFGDERPFAYYPPLYPFFFGVWSWIVGVGLKQSLLFDSFLTITRTMLMLFLVVPSLPTSFFEKKQKVFRWATGILFALLSMISTDRDRPDELALIWGLLLCLNLSSKNSNRIKGVMGSVLLACVGATSPACGVLFAMIVFMWCVYQNRRFQLLLSMGLGSFCFWLLTVMPIMLRDLGSGARFSKQAGISSFPYLRNLAEGWMLKDLWGSWLFHLDKFLASGTPYLLGAVGAFGVALFLLVRCRFRMNSMQKALVIVPLLYSFMVPFVWTLQPYYLWFASIVLMVGILQNVQRDSQRMRMLVIGSYFVFFAPLWFWESKCILNALEIPKVERGEEIRAQVLNEVGPQAKMAVTHDQYFTFRGVRDVVNIDYWRHKATRFDYLYITDLPDSRRRVARSRQLLSEKDQPCFELVKDFSTYTPIHVMGFKTHHFVRGNGGSLFRNVCKDTQQAS